jgi:hypothetical protein
LNLAAVDQDDDPLNYSGVNLPANSELNVQTGQFAWTPTIDQLGSHLLIFSATDNGYPPLAARTTVTVRVLFRAVQQEKDWGFGVKAASTVFETGDPTDLYPRLARVFVDGQPAASTRLVETGNNPTLKVALTSYYDIDRAKTAALIDGVAVGALDFSDVETFGQQPHVIGLAFTLNLKGLAPGEHTLQVRSGNRLGTAVQSLALNVGAIRLTDQPLVFPSPYVPEHGYLTIQYSLSESTALNLLIVGSTGTVIKKFALDRGSEGARAGLNKIVWDGRSDTGLIISNGVYLAVLVDQSSNRVLNKAKITVYR